MNPLKSVLKMGSMLLIGIVIGAALYAYPPELYRTTDDEPPANLVVVSDRIHTSGQPTEVQIGGFKGAGYELVINLAPPQVFGSIIQEGGLVAQTGLYYVNIPVDWHHPRYEDFEFFSDVLEQSGARRVLVHCQVNKRASFGEQWWVTFGVSDAGRLLVVAPTDRNDCIRIISARPATKVEARIYEKA